MSLGAARAIGMPITVTMSTAQDQVRMDDVARRPRADRDRHHGHDLRLTDD